MPLPGLAHKTSQEPSCVLFPKSMAGDLEEVGAAGWKKPGSLNGHVEYCQPKSQSRKKRLLGQISENGRLFPKAVGLPWLTLNSPQLPDAFCCSFSILTVTLRGKNYYPHFKDKETQAQSLTAFP